MKRDLKADLELLENGFYPSIVELIVIAKHAMGRAIKAEGLCRELAEALEVAFELLEDHQMRIDELEKIGRNE